MTTEADLSVADRLAQVLDHLGIECSNEAEPSRTVIFAGAEIEQEQPARSGRRFESCAKRKELPKTKSRAPSE